MINPSTPIMQLLAEAKTKDANRMFLEWYKREKFHLTLPIGEFVKLHDRYQVGIFEQFLNYSNYMILITISGYGIYIAKPKLFDLDKCDDFLKDFFDNQDNGWYMLEQSEIPIPEQYLKNPAATLYYVRKVAIIAAMKYINNIGPLKNKT